MRGVRGVLLASCSATLGVTAHLLGGGHAPHLLSTAAITVLVAWIATAVADRTRGIGGVVVVLGSAQAATHLVLGELSGHQVGGVGMLAGHTVATLATAVVLTHAEAMLAVAASALSALRVLVTDVLPPVPRVVSGAVVRSAEGDCAYSVHLRRAHPRRGPPALS
jgi:hypothetical protein